MTDESSLRVTPRTSETLRKRIDLLLSDGVLYYGPENQRIYFHALTEGTIALVNTGAATDSYLIAEDATLASFSSADIFNATIETDHLEKLVLMGFIFAIDASTISPDTDAQTLDIDLGFMFKAGEAPSYAANVVNSFQSMFEFTLDVIVEAAAVKSVPYCGWFPIPLASPKIVSKTDPNKYYLGSGSEGKQTDEGAFTAITTVTLKVKAYAVLVSPKMAAAENWATVKDFWQRFHLD